MKKSLLFAGSLLVSGLWFVENFTIEVSEYDVVTDKIPESFNNFKILQLSDFHCKSFGNNNKLLLDKIIAVNPDIIIMTGDMVDRRYKHYENFFHLAKALGKRYPVYYTIGNHELDLTDSQLTDMFEIMKGYGVTVINNDSVDIKKGKDTIRLYGMWYGQRFYKDENGSYHNHDKFDMSEMLRLVGPAPKDCYTVLMAHNPLDFKVYADWGADIVFAGHVHGGVVKFPVLGGLLSPGRHFFPKYFEGAYKKGSANMIVSRGVGGIRLNSRPEIVVATLKSE